MNATIRRGAIRTAWTIALALAMPLWAASASAQGLVYITGLGTHWWAGNTEAPYLKIVGLKADLVRRDQLHGMGEFKVTLDLRYTGEKPLKGEISAGHTMITTKMPDPNGPDPDPNDPHNPWWKKAFTNFARIKVALEP